MSQIRTLEQAIQAIEELQSQTSGTASKIQRLENLSEELLTAAQQALGESEKAREWARNMYRVDHYGYIWKWNTDTHLYEKTTSRICTPVIADEAITNEKVADGTLTGEKFQDDSISGEKIKDNTVPGSKLADGSIESVDIKDDTLKGSKLVDNTIDGSKIKDNQIEGRHLIDNSIPGSKIKDGTIENVDIKDNTLDGAKIIDNTVDGAKIANGAINADKLVNNSVTAAKIEDYDPESAEPTGVTTAKIANGAVGTSKIEDYNPESAEPTGVTTQKLANGSVTEAKLANGAVTPEKLADGTIEQLQTITDDKPVSQSVKPIQSGGVFNAIAEAGVVNISEVNKVGTTPAKYSSLSEAIAAVPAAYHRGGMSIKFIQLTPAIYSVVKTEGLTEQPTGTEVQEALIVGTGSYTAAQLSGITLPSAVGNSVTYWLAVTVDEVTTYTTWVITYTSAESQEYVQKRLMATDWSINEADWQGVDREPVAGSRNLVESGGVANCFTKASDLLTVQRSYYNAQTGAYVQNVSGVVSTPKIPVNGAISGYVYLGGSTYPNYGFSFFDDNGFISGYSGTESGMQNVNVPIPSGAKYFSYCTTDTRKDITYILCGIDGTLIKELSRKLENSDVVILDYKVFKSGTVTYNLPSVYIGGLDIFNSKGDIAKTVNVDSTFTFSTGTGVQAIYYNPTNDEVVCQNSTSALNKTRIILLLYSKGHIIGGVLYSDYVKSRTNAENNFLVSQEVLGFGNMRTLEGFDLESTYTNPNRTAKILVVKVNGSEVIQAKRNDNYQSTIAILKEFDTAKDTRTDLASIRATGESSNWSLATVDNLYGKKLPADAKYLLIRYIAVSGNNFLPKYFTIDGYDITSSLRENVYKAFTDIIDASTLREQAGYYRVSSPYNFTATSGYKATVPIAVYVGDIITTNSNFNTPYNTTGNCVMNDDKTIIGALVVKAGMTKITQEMWNNGVRYVGFSFKDSEMTDSPCVTIRRNKVNADSVKVGVLEGKVSQLEEDVEQIKDTLIVKLENLSNFNVFAYDKKGRKITHIFYRGYKTWDSLEYLDEHGETQTATNVQSTNIWNCTEIKYGNKHLCQGNTNFINNPLSPIGDGTYIGDGHGLEVMKYVTFFVDGKEFEPIVSSAEIQGNQFKMILFSEMYKSGGGTAYTEYHQPQLDTRGNPIVLFKHWMEVTINADSDVIVDNKLEVCQDNVSWLMCCSAMMECYFGDFETVVLSGRGKTCMSSVTDGGIPTALAGTDGVVNENSVYASKVEMYGKGFYVSNEIIPTFENSHCNIRPRYYNDRLKCYLYPIRCGEAVGSETPQVFNTGDIIATHNTRHVRLSDNVGV